MFFVGAQITVRHWEMILGNCSFVVELLAKIDEKTRMLFFGCNNLSDNRLQRNGNNNKYANTKDAICCFVACKLKD